MNGFPLLNFFAVSSFSFYSFQRPQKNWRWRWRRLFASALIATCLFGAAAAATVASGEKIGRTRFICSKVHSHGGSLGRRRVCLSDCRFFAAAAARQSAQFSTFEDSIELSSSSLVVESSANRRLGNQSVSVS